MREIIEMVKDTVHNEKLSKAQKIIALNGLLSILVLIILSAATILYPIIAGVDGVNTKVITMLVPIGALYLIISGLAVGVALSDEE